MTAKNLLLDLANFFINNTSVVTADGTDIFRDNLPDSPDNCVGLLEFEGIPSFTSDVSNRSVQVTVRNTDYETARSNIWTLYNCIYKPESDVRIVNLTSSRWAIITARGNPRFLRRDESYRSIFLFILSIVTYRDE
ncbi:MAG: minor capsid protein [Candidatus Heimdallarchaeaceae archaeon]